MTQNPTQNVAPRAKAGGEIENGIKVVERRKRICDRDVRSGSKAVVANDLALSPISPAKRTFDEPPSVTA
jgi:hypothetical protein